MKIWSNYMCENSTNILISKCMHFTFSSSFSHCHVCWFLKTAPTPLSIKEKETVIFYWPEQTVYKHVPKYETEIMYKKPKAWKSILYWLRKLTADVASSVIMSSLRLPPDKKGCTWQLKDCWRSGWIAESNHLCKINLLWIYIVQEICGEIAHLLCIKDYWVCRISLLQIFAHRGSIRN